jgi:hypothetical protein
MPASSDVEMRIRIDVAYPDSLSWRRTIATWQLHVGVGHECVSHSLLPVSTAIVEASAEGVSHARNLPAGNVLRSVTIRKRR